MAFSRRVVGQTIAPDDVNSLQIAIENLQNSLPESVRDYVGLALTAGNSIIIQADDTGDKITISVDDSMSVALAVAL